MFAELHLPIFKQGDDLSHFLSSTENNDEALRSYAQTLNYAASILIQVADRIKGYDVDIQADTHFIGLEGPDGLIQGMIDEEILDEDIFSDEIDDDDLDDDDLDDDDLDDDLDDDDLDDDLDDDDLDDSNNPQKKENK